MRRFLYYVGFLAIPLYILANLAGVLLFPVSFESAIFPTTFVCGRCVTAVVFEDVAAACWYYLRFAAYLCLVYFAGTLFVIRTLPALHQIRQQHNNDRARRRLVVASLASLGLGGFLLAFGACLVYNRSTTFPIAGLRVLLGLFDLAGGVCLWVILAGVFLLWGYYFVKIAKSFRSPVEKNRAS